MAFLDWSYWVILRFFRIFVLVILGDIVNFGVFVLGETAIFSHFRTGCIGLYCNFLAFSYWSYWVIL